VNKVNRNDEYFELLEKLDGVTVPEKCVSRAVRRRKINSFIMKPLASLAVIFLAFVLLVNVSPTVAKALEEIPVIGGVTRAVRFTTRSVRDAVANDYQQPLDMYSTDGDCTVGLRYLIADEKNISFTFELTGDYPKTFIPRCTYGTEDELVELLCDGNDDNTIMTAATTYVDQDIKYPDSGTLTIKLYEIIIPENAELVFTEDGGIVPTEHVDQPTEPFAEFSFDVTVDTSKIGSMKHYDVDSVLVVKGQRIHITGVDMYPTYTAVTVEADDANTSRIESLDFELRDDGMNEYRHIYTSRDAAEPFLKKHAFYTESMYFSETEKIVFRLKFCSLTDKAAEKTEIDLTTGQLTVPTDVIRVVKAEKEGERVYVEFEVPTESQFGEAELRKVGTLTQSEENSSGSDPNKNWSTYVFQSDNYKSDKLKLDFRMTGWYDYERGRNDCSCTLVLHEN